MIALLSGTLAEKTPSRVSSTSPASATTCRCRCRRSTCSASRARRSRCGSTRTCAKTSSRSTGSPRRLEQDLFERLISISGIGPKLALAVLSGIEPAELIRAIRTQDVARLTRIPGVGKKTAERIGLELKDRLPASAADRRAGPGGIDGGRSAARRSAVGAGQSRLSAAGCGEGRRESPAGAARRRASKPRSRTCCGMMKS